MRCSATTKLAMHLIFDKKGDRNVQSAVVLNELKHYYK